MVHFCRAPLSVPAAPRAAPPSRTLFSGVTHPMSFAATAAYAPGAVRPRALASRSAVASKPRALSATSAPRARAAAAGGAVCASRTMYDKIMADHIVDQQEDGTCLIYIDRHMVHEVTSPQAFEVRACLSSPTILH